MSGTITHSWNGTVLTITSDAGTTSADLKGDTGCRGPQGPHGVVYDTEGNIVMDGYATEEYVNEQLANVDLTGYATEIYVDNALADVEVDLTGYATEEYVLAAVDGYATEAYVDSVVMDLATDEAIANAVSGLASEEYVAAEIAKAQLEGAEVDVSGLVNKDDLANYVTQDELEPFLVAGDLATYATKTYVADQINTTKTNITTSYKKYADSKITYGTTDLVAGQSTLASGVIYLVID